MYGRRDLVDAHLFLRSRIAAAVLRTNPDEVDRPLRRTYNGMIIGGVIALVVILVVAVVNFFFLRGNDAWRTAGGTILVDSDSGTRYLLTDDTLHPVRNLTSAALAIGQPPTVMTVSGEQLADVARGAAVGIEGLPDSLPPVSSASPAWTVCTVDGSVSVHIGDDQIAEPAPIDTGALVRSNGQLFAIWGDVRSRVPENWAAKAIGLDPTTAIEVPTEWLNTIPTGADLVLPPVSTGKDGPKVAGIPTVLGQIVTGPNAASGSFMVVADGLMPVTPAVAALVSSAPDTGIPDPLTLSARDLAAQTTVPAGEWQSLYPATIHSPLDKASVPCSTWANGQTTFTVMSRDAAAVGDAPGRSSDAGAASRTTSVDVSAGAGRIVRTAAAPAVAGSGAYLVDESGTKFPIADKDTAKALGVDLATAAPLPTELLLLLPTGPTIGR